MKISRMGLIVPAALACGLAILSALAQDAPPGGNAPRPPPPPATTGNTASAYDLNNRFPNQAKYKRVPLLRIWTSEAQMNRFYVDKFIESAGFGGIRMTVPTMTLDPSLRLVLTRDIQLDGPTICVAESYKVDEIELIGIAKHDQPVAFVVNRHSGFIVNQPIRTAPTRFSANLTITGTRELTDFEKSALAQIQAGKEVVGLREDASGARHLVGAVRAQEACIQCHDGYKVGDALGAFSYKLSKADLSAALRPNEERMNPYTPPSAP